MAWITLTEDNLKARLARAELEVYQDAADQESEGVDQVEGILTQVTAMVRGKVASNQDNLGKMGPAGTIPDECLHAACTIARDSLVASLPVTSGDTEMRKEELKEAHSFLNQVAKGMVRIEDESGSIPEASSNAATYGGADRLDF